MPRGTAVKAALAIPAACALLWWLTARTAPRRAASIAPATTRAAPRIAQEVTDEPRTDAERVAAPDLPPDVEAPMPPALAIAQPLEQVRETLRLYREFAAYPPWSRPFTEASAHYVEWNKLRPEGQAFAVDEAGRELTVEVSLDRMFAGPGEALQATIRAGRLEDGRLIPAAFDLVAARLEINDPAKGFVPVKPLLLDQSGASYAARFVPSELPALAGRLEEVMFTAEVKKGVFFKTIRMPFRYATAPPVQVLGLAGDRIEGGSLVVELDLEVARVAPTLIQAVLYDRAGKTPIAVYDDYVRPTAGGRQRVPITFFGRALREKNVNGPYSIRALHGVSKDFEGMDQYWSYGDRRPALVTSAYAASSFSADEWDSAEKRDKLAQYEKILQAGAMP